MSFPHGLLQCPSGLTLFLQSQSGHWSLHVEDEDAVVAGEGAAVVALAVVPLAVVVAVVVELPQKFPMFDAAVKLKEKNINLQLPKYTKTQIRK